MNQSFIAYLRVSTSKQGSTGVSLSEQRLAIEHHATKHGLNISHWYTEVQSAGSRNRLIFKQLVTTLQAGQAAGLIVHKIDRGARNLADWAQLGELIDRGIDIRFVHDNLDLQSRAGRLAADIQAVVAADFIRNLRDEARKGIRGRFRQGLLSPFPAPLFCTTPCAGLVHRTNSRTNATINTNDSIGIYPSTFGDAGSDDWRTFA